MITCFIRYEIDPFKKDRFETYARNWGQAIPRCGAGLIGYFAPHEGSATTAYGVYNIGGGARIDLTAALKLLREAALRHGLAKEIRIEHTERAKGDVRHTFADGSRAQAAIGFEAQVPLADGLDAEARWVAEQSERS